jgi:UDP-N-acetylglucosamine--N-acetylmuramyl-(pentapeptide) pyrophosphoryl-undecaprenol N-acetylglucosamine transferase
VNRFLIACGGTGGHLSPGISLAEGLAARGHHSTLLISHRQVDARLIEKYSHLHFVRIPGAPFAWSPLRFARFAWQQLAGLVYSLRYIRATRPDAIFGFGGFTTAGIIVAGAVFGVPVALHEANRVPGRAIRMLGRLAQRVYAPPGVRVPGVRFSRLRFVGLPVRREIMRLPRETARARLGLAPADKTLVVLGGSQGATSLNAWARANQEAFAHQGIQLCCVTGLGKGEPQRVELATKSGATLTSCYMPFCDNIAALLSAADLVVSRAGAGTLAELIRCETPAILVPFPHAADDHQWANARFFEQQGGGLVVDQRYLADLQQEVGDVIFNDWLLRKFRSNLRRMDRGNSLDLILDDLAELAAARPSRHPLPVAFPA